jgi:hypothetical protein
MSPHGSAGTISYARQGVKLCAPGRSWQASVAMRAFVWFLLLMGLALAAIALFSYPAWLVFNK